MDFVSELLDLFARQFAARFRSGEFLLKRRNSAFAFGTRELQFLQPRAALNAIFLNFAGEAGELGELGVFVFQVSLDFCDRVVDLLDVGGVLVALGFSIGDVPPRALDQLRKLFCALAIELDATAVRGNFAFQPLHFGTRLGDLAVDLIQRATFLGEGVFAVDDLDPCSALRTGEALNFFARDCEVALERLGLSARVMSFEHAKVRVQRLVAPCFASLSLKRADLPFHLFDHVANAQQICFGRFELAKRLPFLRFVFRDSSRFFEHRAAIFRARAQNHVDPALFHHRVSGSRDAGIGEETLDVAEPAGRFVQEIFGVAIAINAAGHLHVMPIDPELCGAISKCE